VAPATRLAGLRHLLPPRTGGPLALLEAEPPADAVFMAHAGLDGAATLGDAWRGALIGRTVHVGFWRVRAAGIARTTAARLAWLDGQWLRMDDWVETHLRHDRHRRKADWGRVSAEFKHGGPSTDTPRRHGRHARESAMRWILRLAVLGLLVVLAQRLRAHDANVAATAGDLTERRHALARSERELDALGRSIDDAAARVRELDGRITAIERRYPGGVPAGEYDDYTALVQERNDASAEHDALVDRHESLQADYGEDVAHHNAAVDDANALARDGTPWALVQGVWDDVLARLCGQ